MNSSNASNTAAGGGRRSRTWRAAFTLIELMVAVAIIALLISIMIPGFNAVRTRARIVDTQALFKGLESGLESYRGEQALGGVYPPSHSDEAMGGGNGIYVMNTPFAENDSTTPISGANLIVYALVGADRLGTPGFPDLNGDGEWHDNQGAEQQTGAYYIDDQTDPDNPVPAVDRYPGGNATYVDENTQSRISSYEDLIDEGMVAEQSFQLFPEARPQLNFTDSWGRPILYYRANRAGRVMVHDPGEAIGIYEHRDNALLTGSTEGAIPFLGLNFGQGTVDDTAYYSRLADTNYPLPTAPIAPYTFEEFIQDPSVTAQNRPVNPQTYLLISAGADRVYGTSDDVTNWERD